MKVNGTIMTMTNGMTKLKFKIYTYIHLDWVKVEFLSCMEKKIKTLNWMKVVGADFGS